MESPPAIEQSSCGAQRGVSGRPPLAKSAITMPNAGLI